MVIRELLREAATLMKQIEDAEAEEEKRAKAKLDSNEHHLMSPAEQTMRRGGRVVREDGAKYVKLLHLVEEYFSGGLDVNGITRVKGQIDDMIRENSGVATERSAL